MREGVSTLPLLVLNLDFSGGVGRLRPVHVSLSASRLCLATSEIENETDDDSREALELALPLI
jgi:hypothetical protein